MSGSGGITQAEFNHVQLFGGNIWYVDGVSGSDSNDGTRPTRAFLTIGAAIASCAVGDGIVVRAATYTESVVLNVNAVEMWLEIGAVIAPAAGVALTVSGSYCRVTVPNGSLFITAAAGSTGMVVSGNNCYINEVRINCGSSANLGFDLTGNGINLRNCGCADPLVAAYKVQGDKIKLNECRTGGTPADTSIGFWITNTCDKTRLRNCSSQGNISGGYVVDAGCTSGAAENCSSGGGDGRRQDPDHAFIWSGYTFDDHVFKTTTFSGAPTTYGIFKVIGVVKITEIAGVIETAIPNTASAIHLEVYSTGGTTALTNSVGAPDLDSLPAGSLLLRVGDETDALQPGDASVPFAISFSTKDPVNTVYVGADADQDTYIRLNLTAALASGAVHWHCIYKPISDDGFVEAV